MVLARAAQRRSRHVTKLVAYIMLFVDTMTL